MHAPNTVTLLMQLGLDTKIKHYVREINTVCLMKATYSLPSPRPGPEATSVHETIIYISVVIGA